MKTMRWSCFLLRFGGLASAFGGFAHGVISAEAENATHVLEFTNSESLRGILLSAEPGGWRFRSDRLGELTVAAERASPGPRRDRHRRTSIGGTAARERHRAGGRSALSPSNYTVQVSGVAGVTGTILVEIYELP